jgi:hypothetical protein
MRDREGVCSGRSSLPRFWLTMARSMPTRCWLRRADGACFTAAMRKPRAWRWLLDEPPRGVCAPLLEGTRLSRPAEHNSTEQGVERDLRKLCRETTGMMRACYSGQHIDRLVTLCRAAKRAGRVLATAFTTVVEGSPRVCGRCSPPPHPPRRTIRRDQRHPRAPDLSRANGGGWTASRTGDARLSRSGRGLRGNRLTEPNPRLHQLLRLYICVV